MKENDFNNMLELYDTFKKIQNYGYIKSGFKGNGSAGNIFEMLIGKKQDSMSLPDYKNIEIKTHSSTTSYPIDLLSAFPITNKINSEDRLKNFLNICGHYGIKNKNSKYYNDKIYLNEIKYHYDYFAKSYIDFKNQQVVIDFLTYDLILIEKMIWPIKYIYDKIKTKSDLLALISVNKKMFHDGVYYKYNKIEFYKFKGLVFFIKALNEKKIFISFNLELKQLDGIKKVRYHGISFAIHKDSINYLYDTIIINQKLNSK